MAVTLEIEGVERKGKTVSLKVYVGLDIKEPVCFFAYVCDSELEAELLRRHLLGGCPREVGGAVAG